MQKKIILHSINVLKGIFLAVISLLEVSMTAVFLTGCSHTESAQMVNELTFSAPEVSEMTISYDEENLTFLKGSGDEIKIREYMTEDQKRYHANVEQHSGKVHISEGGKPFFKDRFLRYVEIELPASYRNDLTLTTTNGNLDLSAVELDLAKLRIETTSGILQLKKAEARNVYLSTTSGTMELGKIEADKIRLDSTSGAITVDELRGNTVYTSTSGNLTVESAIGSGNYKAGNSGKLDVAYKRVEGNLSLYNKNDDILLKIPKALEFDFHAVTKNGSIKTSFSDEISMEDGEACGVIGKKPSVRIELETKNGRIEVTR